MQGIGSTNTIPTVVFPPAGTDTNPNIYINKDGVIVRQGQTTLDKILATFLDTLRIGQGVTSPQGFNPSSQTSPDARNYQNPAGGGLSPEALAILYGRGSSGGTGDNIESFIRENTGLLLIGGVVVVALMMKPPTVRNGIKSVAGKYKL